MLWSVASEKAPDDGWGMVKVVRTFSIAGHDLSVSLVEANEQQIEELGARSDIITVDRVDEELERERQELVRRQRDLGYWDQRRREVQRE